MKGGVMEPDVRVANHGTISMFTPLTEAAEAWVAEHLQLEDWQYLGKSFSVEHRYARDLATGMQGDGLVVE